MVIIKNQEITFLNILNIIDQTKMRASHAPIATILQKYVFYRNVTLLKLVSPKLFIKIYRRM